MISTIKICFTLYYENLKKVIKSDTIYDIESMSIRDIETEIDIIHMKYILSSPFSVSHNSVQYAAYLHIDTLIQKFNKSGEPDYCKNNETVINECINIDIPVQEENVLVEQNVVKQKGWFS